MSTSWIRHSYHSFVTSSLMDIASCRITIQNVSKLAKEFLRTNGVNWWTTPPESPDANPIENLWHELKEFIRREVKPHNKQELIAGMARFWETVDIAKCKKYIGHLRKVVPKIIECNGQATGY